MLAMVWGTAALGNTRALRQALGIFPCRGLTGCNDIYDRRLNECVSITCLPACLKSQFSFSSLSVSCVLHRSGQQQIKQHNVDLLQGNEGSIRNLPGGFDLQMRYLGYIKSASAPRFFLLLLILSILNS
jgi:hypothetical protein